MCEGDQANIFHSLFLSLSGMETKDKVNFIFAAYDFNGAGELSFDESLLLFRSVVKGLAKLCPGQAESMFGVENIQDLLDSKIEGLVSNVFSGCLTLDMLQTYANSHPVTSSWLVFCTGFANMELSAPEDTVSQFFVDLKLSPDITYAPATFTPVSDYDAPVEEKKEEVKEAPIAAQEGNDEEKAAEKEAEEEENEPPPPPPAKRSKITPWSLDADAFKPEELPPMRKDDPEDRFDFSWMYGYSGGNGVVNSATYTTGHNVVYGASNYVIVSTMTGAEGDGEEAEEGAAPSGTWSQRAFQEHSFAVSCVVSNTGKTAYATADVVSEGVDATENPAKVILWDAATNTPSVIIPVAFEGGVGVRTMEFSRDGALLIVLMNDRKNTINIYKVSTGGVVYTGQHGDAEIVSSICFGGTSDIFIVAGSNGATFYINEGNSFLAESSFLKYERRPGLFGSCGGAINATGAIQTAVCKYEFMDESITGTADGDILFWHGRNCVQVLKAFDGADAVACLTYNPAANILAASSARGRIAIFGISAGTVAVKKGVTKAGPKVPLVRQIELRFSFDLMHLGAAKPKPVSLSLHDSGERLLLGLLGGSVFEVSLKPEVPKTATDGEEGEAPPEPAEGEETPEGATSAEFEQTKPTYGAILWGGPIAIGHFATGGKNASVTGVCSNGPESFISCGSDGAVRAYECKEGGTNKVIAENMCDSGCVTVNASSTLVAVAMDGSLVPTRLGTVQILALPDLKFVAEIKEKEEKVNAVKFNPEGNLLLTNTLTVKPSREKEGESIITSTLRSYALVKGEPAAEGEEAVEKWTLTNTGLPVAGEISAFDFSSDGAVARCTNATTDRLQIFQIGAVEGVPFGAEIKGDALKALGPATTFASSSCCLSWDVLGAFTTLKDEYAGLLAEVRAEEELEKAKAAAKAEAEAAAEAEGDGAVEESKSEEGVAASAPIEEEEVPTTGPGLVARLGATARSQHLMLTSGTGGNITINRIPAYDAIEAEAAVGRAFIAAHSGSVSAMTFIGEAGERLVTAGAEDGLIIVWKVAYDTSEPEEDIADEPEVEAGDEDAPVEDDQAGYDSAEEEDYLDGGRMLAHLTGKNVSEDKLSAVREWVDFVGRSKEDMEPMGDEGVPNNELALDWVYGYSARQTRGAVKYDGEGRIVYPAASLGVVLNKATSAEQTETQSYFMGHTDEITALDVHVASGVAATANKGCGSITLYVWDIATQRTLKRIDCGAVGGVSALSFCPSGRHVVVACQDKQHTVKLFNWKTGTLCASVAGGPNKVLNLTFSASKSSTLRILQGGVGHFKILEYDGTLGFSVKSGRYGSKKFDILTACSLPLPPEGGNEFIVGLPNGMVAFVPVGETTLAGATPVLIGVPVTAMCCAVIKEATSEEPATVKIVIAGGRSQLKVVGSELDIQMELDLSKPYGPLKDKSYGLILNGNVRGFKSVCVDKNQRKILYGTSGGEIGEIDFENGADMNEAPLVSSHFKDSLRGLQAHPIRQECLTAGDDKTVRVWDLQTHKMMTSVTLPDIVACAAYAPNGQIIVAGLGGNVRGKERTLPRDFDGKVAIISYLQGVLNIVHIAGDASEVINDIVFSIDGSRVYAASGDNNIYVYDALDNFKLVNTLKVHGSGISTIDLSDDGKFMLSTGDDGEIVTWDLSSETPTMIDPRTWEATNWTVRSGARNYNSTGLYPAYASADVVTCANTSKDFTTVAGADAHGIIRLVVSPAVMVDAPCKKYYAHSRGGIARLAFTMEDEYLVSVGKDDRCLMQWKFTKSAVAPVKTVVTPVEPGPSDPAAAGTFAESYKGVENLIPAADATSNVDYKLTLNSIKGTSYNPTALYCGYGNIIATSGRKLVVYDEDRLCQSYWARPCDTDEVSAMAVASSSRFVIIGSEENKETGMGSLCILNASTGKYAALLSSDIKGGVRCAAFSHDGTYCAAVGGDKNSTLYLFSSVKGDWTDATSHYSCETVASKVRRIAFLSGGSHDLVTVSVNNTFKWWTISGRNLIASTYQIEPFMDNLRNEMITTQITAMTGLPGSGKLVTGNEEGEIVVWSGPAACVTVDQGSKRPISSIVASSGTSFVSAGGVDVKIWSPSGSGEEGDAPYVAKQTVDVAAIASASCSNARFYESLSTPLSVTSVAIDSTVKRVLVSLSSNAVLEVAVDAASAYVVDEGEIDCGISAVCAHSTEPATLAVALPTSIVKLYDMSKERRELMGIFSTEKNKPSAVTFISDNILAVGIDRSDTGGKSGSIALVEVSPYEPVINAKVGRQSKGVYREMKAVQKIHNIGQGLIKCIKLTPDGKYLTASSADGSVYFFDTKDYDPAGSFLAIGGTEIAGFDFSTDGTLLRAFGPSAAGNSLIKSAYFQLNLGDPESDIAVPLKEDAELAVVGKATWASVCSPVALEAIGTHPAAPALGEPSGSLPSVVSVSKPAGGEQNKMAVGYSNGSIKVFGSPADALSCTTVDTTHPSGTAVFAVFLGNGCLASVGATDGSIQVYSLE